ncbi:MAG TPA: hypothetical protein VFE61_28290 [Candidatus Sulfotelmatobacter sp.]|nr:hypothetical protein [Candidatus Sulfotelmatobacter sp.]
MMLSSITPPLSAGSKVIASPDVAWSRAILRVIVPAGGSATSCNEFTTTVGGGGGVEAEPLSPHPAEASRAHNAATVSTAV